MKMAPRTRTIAGALGCFAAGALCAWAFFSYTYTAPEASRSLRLSQTDYPHINPLLLCNINQSNDINEDKELEGKIRSFVNQRVADKKVDSMSVYVVNYGKGKWSALNEDAQYEPASMLKVPVMIAYYRMAEKNPAILSQQIAYKGDDQNIDEYYRSKDNIVPGRYYTVEELIDSMIGNSDNTAMVLLIKNINPATLSEVYTDLGLPLPDSNTEVQYLSAKLYAYFFRILYNGTYLTREYSEKALTLLLKNDIPGIRAGVPEGVDVAQKFGERTTYNQANIVTDRELHDCGIIYKTDSPYLLCIMTRGRQNDFPTLAKNISDLSALVYDNITK